MDLGTAVAGHVVIRDQHVRSRRNPRHRWAARLGRQPRLPATPVGVSPRSCCSRSSSSSTRSRTSTAPGTRCTPSSARSPVRCCSTAAMLNGHGYARPVGRRACVRRARCQGRDTYCRERVARAVLERARQPRRGRFGGGAHGARTRRAGSHVRGRARARRPVSGLHHRRRTQRPALPRPSPPAEAPTTIKAGF